MTNNILRNQTSKLNELVAKRGWNSEYSYIQNPQYGYQCNLTVNNEMVKAFGTSKQKAKHNASDLMYKLLSDNGKINLNNGEEDLCFNTPYNNYVGQLQELVQKQKLPLPEYILVTDMQTNLAICTVKLLKLSKIGKDPNKKLAKHKAALAMLDELKKNDTNASSFEGSDSPSINLVEDESLSLNQSIHMSVSQSLSPVNENGMLRFSRLSPNIVHASMYQQILDDIARIHKFEVTPVSLNELTDNGFYQCLLQLSTHPVSVFHGKGHTRDEAYALAILNSISYLKQLTKSQ